MWKASFLDFKIWGEHDQPLPIAVARRIAREMRLYDAVGLGTWVGEDFDARVVSTAGLEPMTSRLA